MCSIPSLKKSVCVCVWSLKTEVILFEFAFFFTLILFRISFSPLPEEPYRIVTQPRKGGTVPVLNVTLNLGFQVVILALV